jgi:hypothetical protein
LGNDSQPGVRERLKGVHKMSNFIDNFSFGGTQIEKGEESLV